ncbi:MAG: hypothetical protein COV36_08255 [Alphaproteobacteria bacterium CG11_big_fil_rev_8_21_14_0_20_44_7]|nr:MAG: hypothetical protein COV36_08255 [Alphaproteobacteria bacterium CG11_big_fil_rev_8_21_14_0_20_44_7]
MNNSKKGFTLVELSIVLVIIGLLIGGILVAQSMIETTKVQALVRQLGQFDAAVGNFKDKYSSLPGDSTLISAGDGDGTIEDDGDAIVDFAGEIGGFWYDLGQTGLRNDAGANYPDDTAGDAAFVVGTDIPTAKLGNKAGVLAFGVSGVNYYHIAANGSADEDLDTLSLAFTPAVVLSIDTKMDDGAGNVVASDQLVLDGTGVATTGTDCTTTAGGDTYDVAITTDACAIRVRIGTSTGNYQ